MSHNDAIANTEGVRGKRMIRYEAYGDYLSLSLPPHVLSYLDDDENV